MQETSEKSDNIVTKVRPDDAQVAIEPVRVVNEELTYANNAITTITQRITYITTEHSTAAYPDIDDEITTWEQQLADFQAAHPTESLTATLFESKLEKLKVAVSQNRPQ
ncbi:MAG: hypothetical protein WAU07_04370 [Microgenomates group bacterium]